jgi:hypothetical protein
MTTRGFVATHAQDARFERGLRSFFDDEGHGPDVGLLEIVMPGEFKTVDEERVEPPARQAPGPQGDDC